jgi:hypothetical protein
MKVTKIRVIPKFMYVGEMTAITGHFGIIDKRPETSNIIVVMSTENNAIDDFITIDIDIADAGDVSIMDTSLWKDIKELITNIPYDDIINFIPAASMNVWFSCKEQALDELNNILNPPVPAPKPVVEEPAEAVEQNADQKLYFPMVNGNIYDIDIRNINWEDTVSHARDVAAKQQSFRAIVYNLFKAESTEEERNQMIDNADTIINDAFTALGMDIKYDNMDSGDDPRIMLLLKLFDLNTIYSEFMTHIHMYALRNDFAVTMQRIAENYMDLYKTEQAEETGDPVAEIIDEVADTDAAVEEK